MGKTRVFFRAGQISTVQAILNETPPDKAPWILSRLKEALANRQKAKASAGEAKVMVRGEEGVDWRCSVLGEQRVGFDL